MLTAQRIHGARWSGSEQRDRTRDESFELFGRVAIRWCVAGDIVHQSGTAGPTAAQHSSKCCGHRVDTHGCRLACDVYPSITPASRIRPNPLAAEAGDHDQKRETMAPWGREVREAGWIDLYVTLNGATWEIGGFLEPAA